MGQLCRASLAHKRAFEPASHLRPVSVEGLRRRSAFLQTTPILACIAQETCSLFLRLQNLFEESVMGKYFIGWLLGVPAVVLVGIYVVTHVL